MSIPPQNVEWPQYRLGDLVTRLTNGYVGPTRDIYLNQGIPYLLARHVKSNNLQFDGKTFICEKFNYKNKKSILKAGDVLLVQSGHIGHSAVVPPEHEGHNCHAMIVISTIQEKISGNFLSLFFESPLMQAKFESIHTGSTLKHLNCGDVKELSIPVPPISEQHRIVAILDEAFEGIAVAKANAERNLQNARALFESYLESVFTERGDGWEEKPLVELCESRRVITYGVIKLGDETPNGVPCLRTSNVRWLQIDTNGIKRISPALSSEFSRTVLKGGEVLVNVRGTLGGVAVVPKEMKGWNVSREVAVVPVDSSQINPEFLSYLIGSKSSQQWLGGVKKGAAYVGINIEDLRLLPVGVPAIEEQKQIVENLHELQNETRRLESIYRQKIAAMDELKKSLLHEAFSGRL